MTAPVEVDVTTSPIEVTVTSEPPVEVITALTGTFVEVDGARQLSELSDVGVTTPTDKNALMADGSLWESRALVEGDISDLGSYIDATGVTFENLDTNSDVGTGASQVAAGNHTHSGVYEPADATILKDADIGVSVQAYDATYVVDADIGVNVQAYNAANALTSDITYETLNTNGDVGTVAGTLAIGDHTHTGVYEPADATILKDADISSTVQAYDANLPTWPAAVDATEVGYLDGVSSAIQTQINNKISSVEGTAVLSTGEAGGTKFLREDGDGTCSWQEGSGGASQLSDLSDVGVTTPTNRNVLVADSDSWESRALVEADISDLGSYEPAGVSAADITDSTADGRALLTSADANPFTDANLTTLGNATQPGDVLTRTNTDAFAPTGDYNPATKKYVDDEIIGAGGYNDEAAQDAVGGILTDTAEIDFTYNDAIPQITASIVASSIDESKLDVSVNASLDLADSAVQSVAAADITDATTDGIALITSADANPFTDANASTLGTALQPDDADIGEAIEDTDKSHVFNTSASASVTATFSRLWTWILSKMPFASQAEMEAGTETSTRSMSPERVKQAIDALSGGGGDLVDDSTPQLGGDLDLVTHSIVTTADRDITLTPNGTGNIVLGTVTLDADQAVGVGQDNFVLTYDNATGLLSLEAAAGGGGGGDLVDDLTPQLGGDLDVNGQKIISVSDGDIVIEPDGNGAIVLGDAGGASIRSDVADGAAAVAYSLDTDNSLATSGAKLLSLSNDGTEQVSVDKDGRFYVDGTQVLYNAHADGFTGSTFYGNGGGNLSHTTGTTGYYNVGVGTDALSANTTGGYNSAQGYRSLRYNTTGNYNSAQGANALRANITGTNNCAQGGNALYSNTTGNYNSAQGGNALYFNTEGSYNSAQGYNALRSNTTGSYNCAQGGNALNKNTTGTNNCAQGPSVLYSNTTGSNNCAQGVNALYYNTGGNNSAQGANVLYSNTTGTNNCAQGYNAGRYITGGSIANGTSGTSVYLGANTKALADGDANEIVIGYSATGDGSNSVVIGNTYIERTTLRGSITCNELSADPADPDEGSNVTWQSDGTGSGDDGDIMMKITAGGTTKTVTLVDFSAA